MQSIDDSEKAFFKNTSIDKAVFAALLITVCVLSIFPLHDPDTFWHLANGREMLKQGRIINEEIFSYTAQGTKYDNHEWLSQILLFLAYDYFGENGLLGFKVLIVALTAYMLLKIATLMGADLSGAFLLAVVVILAGIRRYVERPELFSLLMLSVLIYLLYGFKAGKFRNPLYFVPVVFVLWSFLHAAVYGVVFFAAFIAGETVGFYTKKAFPAYNPRTDSGSLRFLWLIFLITLAVMIVNPYGFKVYGMFLKFVESTNVMNVLIAEFMPPPLRDFKLFWFVLSLISFFSVFFIKKIDVTHVFAMLPFAALAVRYNRMTAVFLIASMPALAYYLRLIKEKTYLRRWAGRLISIFIAVVLIYIFNIKFIAHNPFEFGSGVDENRQPAAATRFISETGLKGNMYNDGHFGGYLAFHLYPERKILYMYNYPEVFNSIIGQLHNTEFLEGLNINYAVTEHIGWLNLLFPNVGFVPVFWDAAAVVAIRDTPENRNIIEKYGLKYYLPGISRKELLSLESKPEALPALIVEMATTLSFGRNIPLAEHLGALLMKHENVIPPTEGIALLKKALRYNDKSGNLWASLGSFLYRADDKEKASGAFDKALSIRKDMKIALRGLAYIAYDTGDYEKAESGFKRLLDKDPGDAASLYGLALLHQRTGRYDLARKEWQEFLRLSPTGVWAEKAKENLDKLINPEGPL